MKGYKGFEHDFTCRGMQYEVGKEYEIDGKIELCERGFHFSKKMADVFGYYRGANKRYAEVEAVGDVIEGDDKCVTNKIRIVAEIPHDVAVQMTNTGNWNTGDWNTGDWNTGNRNTGNWNTGNWNTGNWNTGDRNTGNWNTGDWNTGDWNVSVGNSGCFCTEELTIPMFNKPSDMTLRDWWHCDARKFLNEIPRNVVQWVWSSDMTDEEKQAHPSHEATGGYLKVLDEKEEAQKWWDNAEQYKKDAILALPNFDAEIFRQCTGIDIGRADHE